MKCGWANEINHLKFRASLDFLYMHYEMGVGLSDILLELCDFLRFHGNASRNGVGLGDKLCRIYDFLRFHDD